MKAGMFIGLGLMLLSAAGVLVCVVLVASTNGRVSGEVALLVGVPLAILFVLTLALTAVSALGHSRRKRKST